MSLENLSSRELHEKTKEQANRVRQEITVLLRHLAEIDRRRYYLELACESLFTYCVQHLEMSEPQAARYVNAARALKEFPEIEGKIKSGELTMTAVSQAQAFFKREERAKHKFTYAEKKSLLRKIERKSTRDAERILLAHSSQPDQAIVERVRPVTDSLFELKASIDSETLANIERMREVWSHEMPGASLGQIIKKMAKVCRDAHDPFLRAKRAIERQARTKKVGGHHQEIAPNTSDFAERTDRTDQSLKNVPLKPMTQEENNSSTPAPELNGASGSAGTPDPGHRDKKATASNRVTRYIPAAVRHHVYMRDGGACTYVDPVSGLRCSSRHLLQMDHIQPFAMGGENTIENLRLRCADHNALHGERCYGARMRRWRHV